MTARPKTRRLAATTLALALLGAGALSTSACREPPPPPPAPSPSLGPLAHGEGISPKELDDRFGWMEFHPLDDPNFFFRMRVPHGWQAHPRVISPIEVKADEMFSVLLAEVEPPDQNNVFVRVSYQRIPEGAVMMKLSQLLDNNLMQLLVGPNDPNDTPQAALPKWAVLAKRSGTTKGHESLETLVELNSKAWGLSMVRSLVVKKGPLVFTLMGIAPSMRYEASRQAFGVVAGSFDLVTP